LPDAVLDVLDSRCTVSVDRQQSELPNLAKSIVKPAVWSLWSSRIILSNAMLHLYRK
jgi:hypothetical protein